MAQRGHSFDRDASVILFRANGGTSHLDTFDLKNGDIFLWTHKHHGSIGER